MYSEDINGKVVTFDFPVEKRIDFGEFCFIMLEAHGPNLIENNVFGFSSTGKFLWQIDKRVTDNLGRTGGQAPFVAMSIVDDELVLFNFACYRLKVDKCSGEVLETVFTK